MMSRPDRVRIVTRTKMRFVNNETFWGICLAFLCVLCGLSFAGDQPDTSRPGAGDRVHATRERKSSRDTTRKLIVTTILKEPYMMLKQHSMGSFIAGNDRFEGYMADMIKNLSQSIGFDYVIKLAQDGKIGESDLEGRWNGMMGEIQRGEADIAVGPITMTTEREDVVDFTNSFMEFRSTALLRKPRKRRKRNQIETAEDLLQSDIIYGVMDGSITQRLLRTDEDPLHRNMWARMMNFWPTAFVQSIAEGIERARRENYALILDTPTAEYQVGKEPCEFYTIEPFLSVQRYAIALHKYDRLRTVINEQLKVMHDREILSEIFLKWWRSSCELYYPRLDVKTDAPSSATTHMPNKAGKKLGHSGSRASNHHGNHFLVFWLSSFAFFVCYGFSYHDITRYNMYLDT